MRCEADERWILQFVADSKPRAFRSRHTSTSIIVMNTSMVQAMTSGDPRERIKLRAMMRGALGRE